VTSLDAGTDIVTLRSAPGHVRGIGYRLVVSP
jgi:hypothetical protein